MSWLLDAFASELTQRALVGGLLAAVTTSVIGTWVVVRGMSFMGDALAHGVLPGIALAFAWGVDLTLGALVSAAVMVAGINVVHRRARLPEDTGIGLLFVGMLGLGVILISKTDSFAGNLTTILFGDALGVSGEDLIALAVVAVIVLAMTIAFYRHFLVLSFNEQKARLFGLRPGLAHIALLSLITISIVGSFQTVGTLLVFGLLVGPPATAALLVKRVPTMMATAGAIGVLSVAVGLVVSFHANTSGSATMAVIPIVLFFVVLTVKSLRRPAPVAWNAGS
ncbi:MAG: zinc ABC transporter permease AztB [Acidimicrobiia bacterium]